MALKSYRFGKSRKFYQCFHFLKINQEVEVLGEDLLTLSLPEKRSDVRFKEIMTENRVESFKIDSRC